MEKQLVIYDASGRIYCSMSGFEEVPDGLSGIIVEVPDGMRIKEINVSVTPNVAILTSDELEKIYTMSIEEYKSYSISKSKSSLASYLELHPITSTAHNNTEGLYAITEEKQSLMASNMLAYQLDVSINGENAEPITWNETGKACEEWTIEEFTRLILEIKAYVKPLVAKQQHYEEQINACKTKEEIANIEFDYAS